VIRDCTHSPIGLSWQRNWGHIIPFVDYPAEVIYTKDAIESLNMSLRKDIKTRSSLPRYEAVSKLFYLALNNNRKNGQCQNGTGRVAVLNETLFPKNSAPQFKANVDHNDVW
jgi:transposase-like protein